MEAIAAMIGSEEEGEGEIQIVEIFNQDVAKSGLEVRSVAVMAARA